MSTGRDVLDTYRFIYQQFEGDFALSAKVEIVQATAIWSKAWLLVSENLDPNARGLAYSLVGERDARIQIRQNYGVTFSGESALGVRAPGWLRLERKGSIFTQSASLDGVNWYVVGATELNLSPSVYLGLTVASGGRYFGTGVFSNIVFENRVDSDGDGLTDAEELALGTKPEHRDSDGDGFSDYEEARILFSDPLVADIGAIAVVQSQDATARVDTLGTWAVSGSDLLARDQRGWIEYDFEVPADGIYRLSLEISQLSNSTKDDKNEFVFWVDGNYVNTSRVRLTRDQTAFAQVITPFLSAGTHRVRVLWDNTLTDRRIAVHSLAVETIGNEGWVGTRLATINGLLQPADERAATSVSPFFIEGWTHFVGTLRVRDAEGAPLPVRSLPGDGWFAELPLNTDAAVTTATVSFESSAVTAPINVAWVPLDPLDPESEDLVLRRGDALKLGLGAAAASRPGLLRIRRSSVPDFEEEYPIADGLTHVIHSFDETGTYVVKASLRENADSPAETREITVTVEGSTLAADLLVTAGAQASWMQPNLSADVPVQFDSRLSFQETTETEGPRVFRVASSSLLPLSVAARTHDTDLPRPRQSHLRRLGTRLPGGLQSQRDNALTQSFETGVDHRPSRADVISVTRRIQFLRRQRRHSRSLRAEVLAPPNRPDENNATRRPSRVSIRAITKEIKGLRQKRREFQRLRAELLFDLTPTPRKDPGAGEPAKILPRSAAQPGRILDVAAVKAVRVSSSISTSMSVVDSLPDGSDLVAMPVVVSEVIPGMEVTLQIKVTGVTFDDGSMTKILTAADFDSLGRAVVTFIRSQGSSTSACYTISVTYPTGNE